MTRARSHARVSLAVPVPEAIRKIWLPLLCACIVTLLVTLPFVVAVAGAPDAAYFRGSLRPSTDEADYLSAVRLGRTGAWLWTDQFSARPPAPFLIYPTYLLAGHLGALFGLTTRTIFILTHPLAEVVLLLAIWRLAALYFSPRECRWVLVFALAMSGLYWLDALLAAAGSAPVSLTRMGMQQLDGLSLGLILSHEALGVAGEIMALTGLLCLVGAESVRARGAAVAYGACGTLLVGLTLPVVLALIVGVVLICAVWFALHTPATATPPGSRRWVLLAGVLLVLPAFPIALYYHQLFSSNIWIHEQIVGGLQPMEGLLTWGLLLPLAIWGWWTAPAHLRPLVTVLAVWCCCAIVGTAINLWQSARMVTGINIFIGFSFALGMLRPRLAPVWRVRALALIGLGGICQYLYLLTALSHGNRPSLYTTQPEEVVVRWLGSHATTHDVVLAPVLFSNVVPEASWARVVAGEPDLGYDYDTRYPQVQTFFSPATPGATRLRILRDTGATLVVYDPYFSYGLDKGNSDPGGLPALHRVYAYGGLHVYRVAHPSAP
jgi:hypothetical protein